MRTGLRGIIVVLGAALALPAVACAPATLRDSVTGTARDCTAPEQCPPEPSGVVLFTALTAGASSGPAGEDPAGTMDWGERVVGGPLFVERDTDVTCLAVAGNVAIVGVEGTVLFRTFGIQTWIAGLIRVTDGGPGAGQDRFEFDVRQGPLPFEPPRPPEPGPTDCSSFPSAGQAFVNDEGDLIVSDVPPLPTSKEQCKHGGWRSYKIFESKRACIRFVKAQP